MSEENEHWITLKDGRHIKIDTSKYMNAYIKKKANKKSEESQEEINYKNIDMNDYNNLNITKLDKEITKGEEVALARYSNVAYKEINDYLNTGKLTDPYDWDESEIKGYIENIDNAIDKSTLNYNVKVYKGTKSKHYDNYNVGDTFELKMFNSTSLKRGVADGFKRYDSDRITLEILAKKGTKALYMGDFYGMQNEQEILLPKNTRYKVVEKEKNKIVLEVLK